MEGVTSLDIMNEATAISNYNKKKNRKIGHTGYTEVDISVKPEEEEISTKKKGKEPKSKLHPQVQGLMNFIFDMKKIEKSMAEIGFDPEKCPLGNLSSE